MTPDVCVLVAAGFLRAVTHPRVSVEPTPTADALAFVRFVLAVPGAELLPLGPEWPLLDALCDEHGLTGNAVMNAWIAAATRACRERLVTFDRGCLRYLRAGEATVLAPRD